ncbi:MAG: CotH kinase family protein [Bacteroidota bacterium]
MKRILFWLLPFLMVGTAQAQVVVNELMASNKSTWLDQLGRSSDWIELYNASDRSIDLTDWLLTDDKSEPNQFSLPNVQIGPRSFLLLVASGDDAVYGTEIHCNFKLSASGEEIILSRPTGEVVDVIEFGAQEEDVALARQVDGTGDWQATRQPTPGYANRASVSNLPVQASHPTGLYDEVIQLRLSAPHPDAEIRFTRDGSLPTLESPLFPASLSLQQEVELPVDLSLIPTSTAWQLPQGELRQYHSIRAAAFVGGHQAGPVFTATYLIEPSGRLPYRLPVVSIITEKQNLFSPERGLFVEGLQRNFRQKGRDWEIPIHMDYFDTDGSVGVSQKVGLRVSGNTSREYPQKSFKLYARKEYGDPHLTYPFLGEDYDDQFERLSFRSLNADWSNVAISDDLAQEIVRDQVDFEYARRRFVVVFINGEYWGIHSLRDSHDEEFISRHAGVEEEEVCMGLSKLDSEEARQDCMQPYYEWLEFVQENDLSIPDNFDAVAEAFDLNSLQEITASMLYFSNTDWPHHNNRFWRLKNEDRSRWRWVFYDLDGAFKSVLNDNLGLLFRAEFDFSSFPDPIDYQLILALMENEGFRQGFRNKLYQMLDDQFAPERTTAILDRMIAEIGPDLEEHIRRWNYPHNLATWQSETELIRQFLINRPNYLRADLYDRLDFPMELSPNPASDVLQLSVELTKAQRVEIELLDAAGRAIPLALADFRAGQNKEDIQLPLDLPSGMYYLRMRSARHLISKPLVIVRHP